MSIGNIDSTVRNKPTMNAWIPIAFLPIPPKRLDKVTGYSMEEQELDALQAIHEIISYILSPLADAKSLQGIEMVCCDEKVRRCVPKLTAWLADHMENATLHCIATNRCPICVAPVTDFGNLPDQPFEFRPHPKYASAYQASDAGSLREWGIKNINNAFWHIPNLEPHELVKPDTLHTLLLGMLVHLMNWVMEFLTVVGRLTTFDHLWSRLPPYPGFTRPNKAYRSVSQWQGKEMRNLLRVLLGVFAASLSRTSGVKPLSPTNKALAYEAILCVRYLTDFIILAQYKIHTSESIKNMRDYLADFHKYKEVFLRFRATKAAKNVAREASRDLRSEQRLTASDEGNPGKRRKLEQEFRVETEEMVNDMLTEGAHFNFPKMHLISHFTDQISRYGSLPQFSTEICEASHKPLKDAYRRSNHIDAMPQIINTYTRGHSFAMREKNIEQWAKELKHMPEDVRSVIHPTRTNIRAPPGSPPSQLLTKVQGRIDSRMVYNLETLASYYELPDLKMLTTDYLIHRTFQSSRDPVSDAGRLMDAPLEAFNTLQVPVQTFNNDGHILHHLRCTGPDLFRKTDNRHDWVFVRRRRSGRNQVGSLNGRVPAQLNAVFKLRDSNTRYLLAHISLLTVIRSATPDGPEGMVRVGIPMQNHVICITDIEGMAHLIPVEPGNRYLVNNRIDVHTWNDIHDGN